MNYNARSPSPNVGFLNTATNVATNAATGIVNTVNDAAESVGNVFTQASNVVGNVVSNVGNTVANVAQNVGGLNAKNIIPVNNAFRANSAGTSASAGGIFGFSWWQVALMVIFITGFVLIAVFYKEIATYFEGVFKPSAPAPATPPMTAGP